MTPAEILTRLRAAGVRIELRGDKLCLAPKSRLTPALIETVREAKAEVLAHLREQAELAAIEALVRRTFPGARLLKVMSAEEVREFRE